MPRHWVLRISHRLRQSPYTDLRSSRNVWKKVLKRWKRRMRSLVHAECIHVEPRTWFMRKKMRRCSEKKCGKNAWINSVSKQCESELGKKIARSWKVLADKKWRGGDWGGGGEGCVSHTRLIPEAFLCRRIVVGKGWGVLFHFGVLSRVCGLLLPTVASTGRFVCNIANRRQIATICQMTQKSVKETPGPNAQKNRWTTHITPPQRNALISWCTARGSFYLPRHDGETSR